MIGRKMQINDDAGDKSQRTSIKMTRSMSEDIGLKVKEILKKIVDGKINLTYSEWIWFISQCWNDEIWIKAVIIAINKAREIKLDLNKNSFFLDFILEHTPLELKKEFARTHPIARLSLMELVDKQIPEPEKPHKFKELWE